MTGFGSSEKGDFRVEIRSLNGRYLEMNLRLPCGLMEQEVQLRNIIKEKFARGRIDVFVNIKEGKRTVSLDARAAKELYARLDELRRELQIAEPPSMAELIVLKDLFLSEESGYDLASLKEAFDEALSKVEAMRQNEGRIIGEDISFRADILERLNGEMKELLPKTAQALREKFAAKIRAMMAEAGIDEVRVAQEAAVLAEKADIAEELTRITGHLEHMKKMINGKNDKIGRELDFLLQELNREANTVGSKTGEMEITGRDIQFKTEVERIRQQAQNLQ